MTNTDVHENLIVWLEALLGITVIKDRQSSDRPAKPYGMVDLVSSGPAEVNVQDIRYREDPDSVRMLAMPRMEAEWIFLFMVYGDTADDLMRRLQYGIELNQIREPLLPTLSVNRVSRANSIPELINEKWEPRTQVNIFVRGMSDDEFVIDVIEDYTYNIHTEGA